MKIKFGIWFMLRLLRPVIKANRVNVPTIQLKLRHAYKGSEYHGYFYGHY
jgi:hypothetical protein